MEKLKLALKVDDKDNVATIFAEDIVSGTAVSVRDKKGQTEVISVKDDIPYGHKIALTEIPKGVPVLKYGESIGTASREIGKGEYVHVHNMEALRGRGDL